MDMLSIKSFFLVCCTAVSFAAAKIDYCSENIFNSSLNSNYLQFTKELSSSEYSVTTSFKSLHCCAKGYRSIQWFKDGKAYPWASDVSTFILYPESANQTIYAQSLATIDAGNYTCQVSNDSQLLSHTISLGVFDMSGYMDEPLITYNLPSQHFVKVGDTARMFCEAFIGKIDLPDAENEVKWDRPGMNMTIILSSPRIHKKDVLRESDQILGSYYTIDNVKRSDFGDYVCSISNSGDQITQMRTTLNELDWSGERRDLSVPWFKVIFIITILSLIIITFSFVYQHIMLSVLLFLKNLCYKRNEDDDKIYDILVCYISSDTDFIKTTLAVTLQKKYGYNVVYKQLIDPNLAAIANQSRSILLIGSPGMCNNTWTPGAIYNLLRYMTTISNHIVFIPAKPLPTGEILKSDDGKKLETILKKICVVNFFGNKQSNIRLSWIKLRLALPSIKKNFNASTSVVTKDLPTTVLSGFNQPVTTKVNFITLTKSKENPEILL
ncbi:X-linked interleukin-1 receptor accessory protein-like 2 [Lycorma delicatula]|uniref:X-linked interleukin-1 receptor accessory protein-like 2 n=1 Tax=Lycorma delicatula TaxID=130591 RepID=UPI003F50E62F